MAQITTAQQPAYESKEAFSKAMGRPDLISKKYAIDAIFAKYGLEQQGYKKGATEDESMQALNKFWADNGITGPTPIAAPDVKEIEDIQYGKAVREMPEKAVKTAANILVPVGAAAVAGAASGGNPFATIGAYSAASGGMRAAQGVPIKENLLQTTADAAGMFLGGKGGELAYNIGSRHASPFFRGALTILGGGIGTLAPEVIKEKFSDLPPTSNAEKAIIFALGGAGELFANWIRSGRPAIAAGSELDKAIKRIGLGGDDTALVAALSDDNVAKNLRAYSMNSTASTNMKMLIDKLEASVKSKITIGEPLMPADIRTMDAVEGFKKSLREAIEDGSNAALKQIDSIYARFASDPGAKIDIDKFAAEVRDQSLTDILTGNKTAGTELAEKLSGTVASEIPSANIVGGKVRTKALEALKGIKENVAEPAYLRAREAIKDTPLAEGGEALLKDIERVVLQIEMQNGTIKLPTHADLLKKVKDLQKKVVTGTATAGEMADAYKQLNKVSTADRSLGEQLGTVRKAVRKSITDGATPENAKIFDDNMDIYANYAKQRNVLERHFGKDVSAVTDKAATSAIMSEAVEGGALEAPLKYVGVDSAQQQIATSRAFADIRADIEPDWNAWLRQYPNDDAARREIIGLREMRREGKTVADAIRENGTAVKVLFPSQNLTGQRLELEQAAAKKMYDWANTTLSAEAKQKWESLVAAEVLGAVKMDIAVGGDVIGQTINRKALKSLIELNPQFSANSKIGKFLSRVSDGATTADDLIKNADVLAKMSGKDMPAIASSMVNYGINHPDDMARAFRAAEASMTRAGSGKNLADLRAGFVGALGDNGGKFDFTTFAKNAEKFNPAQLEAFTGSKEAAQNLIDIRTIGAEIGDNLNNVLKANVNSEDVGGRRVISLVGGGLILAGSSLSRVPAPIRIAMLTTAYNYPPMMAKILTGSGRFATNTIEAMVKVAPQTVKEFTPAATVDLQRLSGEAMNNAGGAIGGIFNDTQEIR